MRVNGQLKTCDRCGESVFLKTIGDGDLDGGYTRWNKFEPSEGWSVEHGIGDLCPTCTTELETIKEEFKWRTKRWAENPGPEKEGSA